MRDRRRRGGGHGTPDAPSAQRAADRAPSRRGLGASSAVRDSTPPPRSEGAGTIDVHAGDNLAILPSFPDASFDLIYIDPPFNTGRAQVRTRTKTVRDDAGDRVGFEGRRYCTTVLGESSFEDRFDDYLEFLLPRLEEAYRLLAPSGSFFLHLDYREVHYAKVALDRIFGRASFINEIIWAYDYGARSTKRWSPKHDNILFYAKNPKDYCFNFDAIDRIPYMAPSLVCAEKAARGKTPTDTWWNTIVSPTGKEKTGYPTQKPLAILTRIVQAALAARRSAARLLRGERELRRGGRAGRAARDARRRQPGGDRDHAAAVREVPGRLPRGRAKAGGRGAPSRTSVNGITDVRERR
jgi:site-specific DNA-methyltransferase (adenine-specific)